MTRSLRFLPAAGILAGWLALAGWWTSGFRAFTTDAAALRSAGPLPRPAPDLAFRDTQGRLRTLAELRGRYVLLTFMYLNCPDVCHIVTGRMHEARASLAALVPDRLVLVSVSIDPERDTSAALVSHMHGVGDSAGWIAGRLTRPLDAAARAELAAWGVWALRDATGRIKHAAYVFLVDPRGQVVAVYRPEASVETFVDSLRRTVS
jgi:protein SCO1/2